MKKLTIEEKARRFDEAINIAKSKIENDKDHVLYEEDIINIFPELKESDDERICREITTYLSTVDDKELIPYESWVAWLEKQGQTFTKKDVDDAYLKGMCDAKHELEKQGEQKPIERKDFISVPLGAFDSELVNETITIPDGCVATIEGNKIHIKREDL